MRVKIARDPALTRAAKSKVAARRPLCEWCGQRMPAPSSPQWSGFLEPYGHRQPWAPFEPCPSWKKLAPIAPPPPRPQPACRPAQPTGDTLTVEQWQALFDAMRIEPTKRPRVKREPRAVRQEAASQLVLFTPEGRLWCELRETGLRLVAENSQGAGVRVHDQGTMRLVAKGAGRG